MPRADRLVRSHLRERYLVTLHDGTAFDGLLMDADATTIVLVDAQQVAPNGDRLQVDGQIWLPRSGVAYMQRPKA